MMPVTSDPKTYYYIFNPKFGSGDLIGEVQIMLYIFDQIT